MIDSVIVSHLVSCEIKSMCNSLLPQSRKNSRVEETRGTLENRGQIDIEARRGKKGRTSSYLRATWNSARNTGVSIVMGNMQKTVRVFDLFPGFLSIAVRQHFRHSRIRTTSCTHDYNNQIRPNQTARQFVYEFRNLSHELRLVTRSLHPPIYRSLTRFLFHVFIYVLAYVVNIRLTVCWQWKYETYLESNLRLEKIGKERQVARSRCLLLFV